MITQESIILASPIALAVKDGVRLMDNAGQVIQGLTSAVTSLEGYSLSDLAVKLPEETSGENNQHTILMNDMAATIGEQVRISNSHISKFIVPICDKLQDAMYSYENPYQIDATILEKVWINYINIDPDIFNLSFYPDKPSPLFNNDSTLDSKDFNIGKLPEKSGSEVLDFIKPQLPTPEFDSLFEDDELLAKMWRKISYENNLFNILDIEKNGGRLSSVNLDFNIFKEIMICSLITSKLKSLEDPLEGTIGVTLEDYENNLNMLNEAFNHALYMFKNRVANLNKNGLVILSDKTKMTESTATDSLNDNVNYLMGDVVIGYTKAAEELFSNSVDYGMPEIVIGMLLAKKQNNVIYNTPLTNLKELNDVYSDYKSKIKGEIFTRLPDYVGRKIDNCLDELAEKEFLKDFLDNYPGFHEATLRKVKLKSILNKDGKLKSILTNVNFLKSIINNEKSLLETNVAVEIANSLGLPMAAEIIKISMDTPCSCEKEQRINLAKAMAKLIISKLMK